MLYKNIFESSFKLKKIRGSKFRDISDHSDRMGSLGLVANQMANQMADHRWEGWVSEEPQHCGSRRLW